MARPVPLVLHKSRRYASGSCTPGRPRSLRHSRTGSRDRRHFRRDLACRTPVPAGTPRHRRSSGRRCARRSHRHGNPHPRCKSRQTRRTPGRNRPDRGRNRSRTGRGSTKSLPERRQPHPFHSESQGSPGRRQDRAGGNCFHRRSVAGKWRACRRRSLPGSRSRPCNFPSIATCRIGWADTPRRPNSRTKSDRCRTRKDCRWKPRHSATRLDCRRSPDRRRSRKYHIVARNADLGSCQCNRHSHRKCWCRIRRSSGSVRSRRPSQSSRSPNRPGIRRIAPNRLGRSQPGLAARCIGSRSSIARKTRRCPSCRTRTRPGRSGPPAGCRFQSTRRQPTVPDLPSRRLPHRDSPHRSGSRRSRRVGRRDRWIRWSLASHTAYRRARPR